MVRATVENVSLAPKAPDEKKDEAHTAQKGVSYNQLTVGVVKESERGEQRCEPIHEWCFYICRGGKRRYVVKRNSFSSFLYLC